MSSQLRFGFTLNSARAVPLRTDHHSRRNVASSIVACLQHFWQRLALFVNVIVDYHGLRGSASPVLTATGFVNWRWQFSTPSPTESTPLERSPKKLVQVTTSAASTAVTNLVQIRPRGLLGKWVKYNEIFFIYLFVPFFHVLTYKSDPSTNFHARRLKRRGLAQGCAFWGFR